MQPCRAGCPAVTDGLDDRFRESQTLLRRVRGRTPALPPAYRLSATRSRQPALSARLGKSLSLVVSDLSTLCPGRRWARSCELPRLTVIARPCGHVAGTPADQGPAAARAKETGGARPGRW